MTVNRTWRFGAFAAAVVAFGVLCVGATRTAIAQGSTGQARPTSVAVVSIPKVLEGLREREDKEGELRSLSIRRETLVNDLGKRAKATAEELNVLQPGTDEWKAKREEAMRLEASFRLETEIAERTLSEQQKIMQLALFKKILAAIKTYAEREGYDLVLTSDAGVELPDNVVSLPDQQFIAAVTGRRVAYASPSIDITDEVMLSMNNEYKAPSP